MLLYIQEEVLEFDNDPKITEQIFNMINEQLERRKLRFSHLIIDGVAIHDDIYAYFINNMKNIKKVEVVVKTTAELTSETIRIARNYIENAVPLITEMAEEFYQQPNAQTWTKLNDLFEGIQWIITSLAQIDSSKNLSSMVDNYEIWNEYVQEVSKLNIIIPEFEGIIIDKDIISIGDMLLYEIKPVFENMSSKLKLLIPGVEVSSVS